MLPDEPLLVVVFGAALADALEPATVMVPFMPRPRCPSIGQNQV